MTSRMPGLSFPDIGQVLPGSLGQRVPGRQYPFAARDGVAKHGGRVTDPAYGRLDAPGSPGGPACPGGWRRGFSRIRAALLEDLRRRRHPPGRETSGGKSRARRNRFRMAAAEYPVAAGKGLL
jgi:hypothetical protein